MEHIAAYRLALLTYWTEAKFQLIWFPPQDRPLLQRTLTIVDVPVDLEM